MTSTASVPPPALCPSDWSSAAREACGRFQYLTSQPPASVTSWKYAEGVSFPLGHNSEMEFRKRISVVTRPNRISASGVMRCCIPKKKKKINVMLFYSCNVLLGGKVENPLAPIFLTLPPLIRSDSTVTELCFRRIFQISNLWLPRKMEFHRQSRDTDHGLRSWLLMWRVVCVALKNNMLLYYQCELWPVMTYWYNDNHTSVFVRTNNIPLHRAQVSQRRFKVVLMWKASRRRRRRRRAISGCGNKVQKCFVGKKVRVMGIKRNVKRQKKSYEQIETTNRK